MHYFCTLFDKNYLYKGLTLYYSLLRNDDEFHLWILCLDDLTFSLLEKMDLENASLIAAADFENEGLIKVKKERTVTEYSWTCTANLCRYMLEKINARELITYLDADMCFFSNPEPIFKEIGNSSIAIVEHRLEGERKKMEKYVGKYNVAWVSFRKDDDGIQSAEWWKERVLEWCGAYFKGGKIGDQHYLNDWPQRFDNVCVIGHEGADVAPWNVANRKIKVLDGQIMIGSVPLIFYHFHSFILISNNRYISAPAYFIPQTAERYIYRKYFDEMKKVISMVRNFDSAFNYGFKKNYFKSLAAKALFRFRLFNYIYIKYSCRKFKKSYDQKD